MKVVIVGAGNIAQAHVDAVRGAGGQVVGVCTRTDSGSQFAQKNEIPHWSQNLTDLIGLVRADAVMLLTQPSSFRPLLAEIRPLQIPVFLEKPVGYSVEEAEGLLPLLPKQVFVGHNRRFYSGVQRLTAQLQSARGMFVQLYLPERAKDIRPMDEVARNSWQYMNGIHGIDLLTYLAGRPTRVIARESWGTLDFTRLPQFHTALLETDRENRVSFMGGFDCAGGWRLHFFLSNQEEVIFAPFEETKIRRLTGIEVLETAQDDLSFKPGFLRQARSFLDGLKSGGKSQDWVSFEESLESMRAARTIFGHD